MTPASRTFSVQRILLALAVCVVSLTPGRADEQTFLGTKTPYSPQQDSSTYQAPPPGFVPVFTELVARHGSRGLSSPSNDLAFYQMWLDAQASGNLTAEGARLGAELQNIIRANALLGYGVSGITAPGYGNLTATGITEHKRLAKRLVARMRPLLSRVAAEREIAPRQIVVSTSGVNRAIDSANFFVQSLTSVLPGLAPLVVNSPALTAYPVNKPAAQAPGVNRFQLYFHKLAAKTDLPSETDPYDPVYQSSLEYQNYLASDPTMIHKVNSILYSDSSKKTSRELLETIFTKSFVDRLEDGSASYSNTGNFSYTSDDGMLTASVVGDGETTLANVVDAANALYAVYSITPAMTHEVRSHLDRYFTTRELAQFGYLSDVEDFYQKGPGITEASPITYKMSQALLDDFFSEVEAIASGNLAHAAKLRFTHAEIIIPFAERLGLRNASVAVPADDTYTYRNNPWRGEDIAPLAANVQWDVYANGGRLLVKMFYNEREIDFPASCEPARYSQPVHGRHGDNAPKSHFYDYDGLKTCYGY
jgi:hypothetical protein